MTYSYVRPMTSSSSTCTSPLLHPQIGTFIKGAGRKRSKTYAEHVKHIWKTSGRRQEFSACLKTALINTECIFVNDKTQVTLSSVCSVVL